RRGELIIVSTASLVLSAVSDVGEIVSGRLTNASSLQGADRSRLSSADSGVSIRTLSS
ncbi:MAG: hypothetical protein ACI8U4_001408, partial [Natronomonas sp.]